MKRGNAGRTKPRKELYGRCPLDLALTSGHSHLASFLLAISKNFLMSVICLGYRFNVSVKQCVVRQRDRGLVIGRSNIVRRFKRIHGVWSEFHHVSSINSSIPKPTSSHISIIVHPRSFPIHPRDIPPTQAKEAEKSE